jgi:hypothetical protein
VIVIGFFVLYAGLALLLGVMVFRLLRRRGWLVALLLSLLCLGILGLFFPVPMHGGFTFPLEIAWHELKRVQWQQEENGSDEKRLAFKQQLERRFATVIHLSAAKSVAKGWSSTQKDDGEEAWLDEESGLLWRAPQAVNSGGQMLTLDEAKEFCHAQPRQGYWSLPTEAELALFWRHGGHRLMPGTGQSSTALLADDDLQIEMATHYRGRVAGQAVRCVAITDVAPRGGYHGRDIPLALWNDYQLNKGEIYSATGKLALPVPYQGMQ